VKSSKSAISATITLGICSLAGSASADTFIPRFPVSELHAMSTDSAGSLAACAVMGAQGFSNATPPPDWETFITSSCTAKTKTLAGPLSLWPATCNPTGMALALNAFTPAADWIKVIYSGANQAAALNETVLSLQTYGSPAVVPIYGQADHWVVLTQIIATNLGGGSFNITNVKGFDGGRLGGFDSGGTNFYSGQQTWGAVPWKNTFYLVVTAINPSCDGAVGGCGAAPVSDPFYNNYVLMFEPPAGPRPQITATFDRSPAGIVPAGTNGMNEHQAQTHVYDALSLAGIDQDLDTWAAVAGGVPGTAFHVNAVWPDGSPWNYYLVPIMSSTSSTTAIGFVQLDGDDGSFQGINVPTHPVPFVPASMLKAQQLASGVLAKGETLGAGKLTWNPRGNSQLVTSPNFPYYEFSITGSKTSKAPIARVTLHNGTVVRID